MGDLRAAKILSHERNIQRYWRLLATELTELERQYLHKRIAEERAELGVGQYRTNQKTHPMSLPHRVYRTNRMVSLTSKDRPSLLAPMGAPGGLLTINHSGRAKLRA